MRDGRNPNDASTSDWAFSFEAIIASIIIVIMTIHVSITTVTARGGTAIMTASLVVTPASIRCTIEP